MWFGFFVGLFGSLYYGSRVANEKTQRKELVRLKENEKEIRQRWLDTVVTTYTTNQIIDNEISKMNDKEKWEEVKEVYEDIFSKYDLTELCNINSWCREQRSTQNILDADELRRSYFLTKNQVIFNEKYLKQIILAKRGLIDRFDFAFTSSDYPFYDPKGYLLIDILILKWCEKELKSHNLDIKLHVKEKEGSKGKLFQWYWEIH